MTATALLERSTGDDLRAEDVFMPSTEGHTRVVYGRVDDLTLEATLLTWDRRFEWTDRLYPQASAMTSGAGSIVASSSRPLGNAERSAVEVVEQLAAALGLPTRDILEAAGIRRRTFYYWKRRPLVRRRLSSVGNLWSMAQAVDAFKVELGSHLVDWIAGSPERREKFQRGEFDVLRRELATQRALATPDLDLRRREEALSVSAQSHEAESASDVPSREARPSARLVSRRVEL